MESDGSQWLYIICRLMTMYNPCICTGFTVVLPAIELLASH